MAPQQQQAEVVRSQPSGIHHHGQNLGGHAPLRNRSKSPEIVSGKGNIDDSDMMNLLNTQDLRQYYTNIIDQGFGDSTKMSQRDSLIHYQTESHPYHNLRGRSAVNTLSKQQRQESSQKHLKSLKKRNECQSVTTNMIKGNWAQTSYENLVKGCQNFKKGGSKKHSRKPSATLAAKNIYATKLST